MRPPILGLQYKPVAWVQASSDLFMGRCVCVEPYDNNTCQDLWFGSGASPPWNKVQSHYHSHEFELLLFDNLPQDTTKPPVIAFANPKLVSTCVRCRWLPILVGSDSRTYDPPYFCNSMRCHRRFRHAVPPKFPPPATELDSAFRHFYFSYTG